MIFVFFAFKYKPLLSLWVLTDCSNLVTHYKVILWHNILGRLLKLSLPSGILPPYYSWDLDTNLLRARGNSADIQRSHTVPGKSDVQASLIVILADVIQSGLSTCPNNLQPTSVEDVKLS